MNDRYAPLKQFQRERQAMIDAVRAAPDEATARLLFEDWEKRAKVLKSEMSKLQYTANEFLDPTVLPLDVLKH